MLEQHKEYKDAGALLGGLSAWEAAGYEVVKAPPSPTPTPAPPKKN
ncbi:MAG: hypothetical protein JNK38_02970 [Acidobacteria bacterium]|nr:hypothetical protein [Acidobacteriota bacterium]